jgi:hypothetical protein
MRVFPRTATLFALALVAALAAPASSAAEPKPEIQRDASTPQPIGAAHTLRRIPEACARMEGRFTGDAADPYAFSLARTSASCQPRAQFVDAAKVKPSLASGWKLNDLIRVPNADCPSQQAVVRVWRKPAEVAPPKLDAQGRSRVYLKEMQAAAQQGRLNPVPLFAAEMAMAGESCGG